MALSWGGEAPNRPKKSVNFHGPGVVFLFPIACAWSQGLLENTQKPLCCPTSLLCVWVSLGGLGAPSSSGHLQKLLATPLKIAAIIVVVSTIIVIVPSDSSGKSYVSLH